MICFEIHKTSFILIHINLHTEIFFPILEKISLVILYYKCFVDVHDIQIDTIFCFCIFLKYHQKYVFNQTPNDEKMNEMNFKRTFFKVCIYKNG